MRISSDQIRMLIYCKCYWELAKIKVLISIHILAWLYPSYDVQKNSFVIIIRETVINSFTHGFTQLGKAEFYQGEEEGEGLLESWEPGEETILRMNRDPGAGEIVRAWKSLGSYLITDWRVSDYFFISECHCPLING